MKFTRRKFTKVSSLSLLSYSLMKSVPAVANESDNTVKKLGFGSLPIFQGATDENSTVINVLFDKGQKFLFAAYETITRLESLPNEIFEFEIPFTNQKLVTCYFKNLELVSEYEFVVKTQNQTIADKRIFHMVAEHGSGFNFALGSCMNEYKHKDWIYHSLENQKPEALFLIGDQVYADKPSSSSTKAADEQQLWKRYTESRLKLEFYRLQNLIPTFSSWDDHDIGLNNCDRNYVHLDLAQKIFDLFFPCDSFCSFVARGPGNSKLVKLRNQNFFMLDGRSFRSEASANDETMFGVAQTDWLFKNLSGVGVTWLMAGTQWSVDYAQTENFFKTHPNDFKDFMKKLKNSGAKIVFASGDVHFSEITKVTRDFLDYETIEFTASSFHSTFLPGMDRFLSNSNRIVSKATQNFLMLNCQNTGVDFFEGKVTSITKGSVPVFEVDFSVDFSGDLNFWSKRL